jgi:DNA-binding NtrC family response regulator
MSRIADRPGELLWIEDDADVLYAASLAVQPLGCALRTARHPREVAALLDPQRVDVVVLDLNFRRGATDGAEGFACLADILRLDPDAVVVIASAFGDVAIAVDAIKRGATDFITKPWMPQRLLATLQSARRLRQERRAARDDRARLSLLAGADAGTDSGTGLLGTSAAMRQVRSLLARAAPTDANVLLIGENGTGKELAARDLHRLSQRAGRTFVSVDLGALSATVFDSELFGHRRGAFTDAHSDRIGRLQAGHGGTVFLDEIGNLPLALQPKLLSALEQRSVTPVGGNVPVALDIRVVTATNLRRERLEDESVFRRDLLYRLNTITIELPPLRARRDDIVPLAEQFLRLFERKYGRPTKPLAPDAAVALSDDPWPGNVRALRHAAERAVILGTADRYETGDFALAGAAAAPCEGGPGEAAPSEFNLERREREAIERALRKHQWKVALAARELGLSRGALYRRMDKYGL